MSARPFIHALHGAPPLVAVSENLLALADYQIPAGCALMLRNCAPGGLSKNGFVWPLTPGAVAVCPDWSPVAACGNGLHGWLWGEGDLQAAGYDIHADCAVWLVVEVVEADVVQIERKIKVPSGRVVASGKRHEVCCWLAERAPGKRVHFGTATAGYGGTATAGYRGTATAGDGGTATAGDGGTATAGECGSISVRWWDGRRQRYRLLVAEVGENGIEANNAYCVVDGKFVAVKP